MTTLYLLCVLVICAAITSAIAKRKGLNAGAWAAIGFFFGVLAVVIIPFWPKSKNEIKTKSYLPNMIAGGLGLAGLAFLASQTNVLTELAKGTYDCDNLVSEIVSLSEQQAAGPKILGIFEIKTVKNLPESTECTGLAVMSDQSKLSVSYRAYIEYDQWWVVYDFI